MPRFVRSGLCEGGTRMPTMLCCSLQLDAKKYFLELTGACLKIWVEICLYVTPFLKKETR